MTANRAIALDRGLLLAIDGIDGAGKTTQARAVEEALRSWGLVVVVDKEPTDGPDGTRLRESAITGRLSREEELRLFHADRARHVEMFIKPCLANGTIVILDRYYYSTAAYQGRDAAEASDLLRQNEGLAPRPDVAVLLDLDPSSAVQRLIDRGQPNRFETLDGLHAARSLFNGLQGPELHTLDATQSREALTSAIVELMRPFIVGQFDTMAARAASLAVDKADAPAQFLSLYMRHGI